MVVVVVVGCVLQLLKYKHLAYFICFSSNSEKAFFLVCHLQSPEAQDVI